MALKSRNITATKYFLSTWGADPMPSAMWDALHAIAHDATRFQIETELKKFVESKGLGFLEIPLWALLQLAHLPVYNFHEASSCATTLGSSNSTSRIEGKQEEEIPPCRVEAIEVKDRREWAAHRLQHWF